MREIAQAAGVAQALLHYHFRNKETLYEAVFERRASTIRAVPSAAWRSSFGREDPVALEDVLAVLFMSLEELLGARRGDLRYYVQMLADVTTSTDPRSTQIIKRLYDPPRSASSRRYAACCRSFRRSGRSGHTSSPSARGCKPMRRPTARAAWARRGAPPRPTGC